MNNANYTIDAAKAVYAAIQGLVSNGKRAYSLSVPIEAEKILIKQAAGRINSADANSKIKDAINGLSREGKIEAYAEQRKDWVIKEPLQENSNVLPALSPQAELSSEKQAEIFILKPTIWGLGVDLKEVWRRIKKWNY